MASSRPSVIDGLDVNEVKDGLIVYEETSDRVHYLNGSASIVFSLCDGEHTVSEIAEVLATAYQLDAVPASTVEECLASLEKEGLLK